MPININKRSDVNSVNGKVGDVVLNASDIGALSKDTNIVIGVKGEVETDYRVGNVNITKENIGLKNVANERQWSETNHPTTMSGYGITDVASSADYNTLKGRVDTNEDNIAILDSDVEGLTTDVVTLKTDMTTVKGAITTIQGDYVPKTRKVNGKALSVDITLEAGDVKAIPISQKGTANGIAELDENGIVPSSQLPSYVDDVLEYDTKTDFPTNGESGKIYIATDTNVQYRWTGTQYVEISSSLALGETSSTAYRGDRGKIAYDHSQKTSGNPHNVTKSDVGLGNVDNTADLDKSVKNADKLYNKSNDYYGVWLGGMTIPKGTEAGMSQSVVEDPLHRYIKPTSIIDIYYDDNSVQYASEIGMLYNIQESGGIYYLTISVKKDVVKQDIVIQNILVRNP